MKYNLNRTRKHLIIPISKSSFIMINQGGHNKLYYPANADAIRWFVKFEYQHLPIEEITQKMLRPEREQFWFKDGIKNPEISMIADNEQITIARGRTKYGEDPEKFFFVLKLGVKKLLK